MEILHVFNDDKFIDPAIKLIESVYPNSSLYFIIQSNESPFKYVKSPLGKPLILKGSEDEINFVKFIHDNKIKVVFFHALDFKKQHLVNLLKDEILKVWFIWGYDLYYNWPLFKKNIFEKETKKYLNINFNTKEKIIYNTFSLFLFKNLYKLENVLPNKIIRILKNKYDTAFYKAVKKIDIVVPVVPTEYKLVRKIDDNNVYGPFTYGCIEDILNDKINDNVLDARNILIGNSGDPSNNHLDIFKKLNELGIHDRKIIVPLSYAGSKDYIAHVIEIGKRYFGENFIPLVNFMPLKEYNQLVSSCGFVVFNHVRQQAVANIIAMSYMGAKIFLNEKSPVYEYYKSIGINLKGIKQINKNTLITNLTLDEFKRNQRILFDIYSRDAVQNKIKILLNVVNQQITSK
ncbi:TDP-N-acetylfucosamine:lipid II N-acetylfucosaminyltransferase [Lutibacter maritimus]|uniref:4-alpha-L-fucosyltransferase glycosyl transferase group 56 n=1 Tax=Lutibacter maritimus TaxID=593133 RepID=A0A1I6SNW5_9FLAO|nr:TDP-N-acetylfucosamine:lipid II N-acetylfucosaminyltransferase [Lutibacter maritimus]SFS78655.1 4-alpha-L-fucosyltransferase glycosyl transferase group 56 [Lutibacter maritimus]